MSPDRASPPEAKPQRLFVAVDVPESVRKVVWEALAPWRLAFPEARWLSLENWHVTLAFLGATSPHLVPWVGERLGAVAVGAAPFGTSVSGLGSFPTRAHARVLWVGLQDPDRRLEELARDVGSALEDEFSADLRPFRAHLTVARSDPPLVLPDTFVEQELSGDAFAVDALTLYRSDLGQPAPRYEVVDRYPFGG